MDPLEEPEVDVPFMFQILFMKSWLIPVFEKNRRAAN